MTDDTDNADAAPGWDAIDAALRSRYGEREPFHFGSVVSYRLGGADPIHGISAYRNSESEPHWHFVTYGFSELWKKETSDPEVSGYGFELTFRTTDAIDAESPPIWALIFCRASGATSSKRAMASVLATHFRATGRSQRVRPHTFTRSALHTIRSFPQ